MSLYSMIETQWVREIRFRALETFEEKGFVPPADFPTGFDDRSEQLGTSIWRVIRTEIEWGQPRIAQINLAEHSGLSETLPRMLAFGYSTAGLFHRRYRGNPRSEEASQRLGALFNAAICCIDRVWDVEKEHRPFLQSRLTEAEVATALHHASLNRPLFSEGLGMWTPVLPTFVCRALDAYVIGLRAILRNSSMAAFGRRGLRASIIALLQGHERSGELRIDRVAPTMEICETLREIGSGPFRIVAQTSLLTRERCGQTDWIRLSEDSLNIGDIFRWTDDLVDAFEDLSRGVWNSVWITFVRRGGEMKNYDGHTRTPQELLPELLESEIVESVASRIVRRATVLNQEEAEDISSWVWAWLS